MRDPLVDSAVQGRRLGSDLGEHAKDYDERPIKRLNKFSCECPIRPQ